MSTPPLQHPPLDRRDFLRTGVLGALAWWLTRDAEAAPVRSMAPRAVMDLLGSQMVVIRRSAWSRTAPTYRRLKIAGAYSRITVHHTGTQPLRTTSARLVAQEIGSIQGAHLSQHYGDIAYHLIVDYAGRVWEGRSLAFEGAHTMSANESNIGIMLLGNFERQAPSPAQLATLDDLVALLRRQYRIRRTRIYGHRDLSPSACPGRQLYPYVAQLRQA
jgi:N-acetyl-anhydromuramyl-L-alanine amidase AmpD